MILGHECSMHAGGLHSLILWTSVLSLSVVTHYMCIWKGYANLVSTKKDQSIIPDAHPSPHKDMLSTHGTRIHMIQYKGSTWEVPYYPTLSADVSQNFWCPLLLRSQGHANLLLLYVWDNPEHVCHGIMQNIWDGGQLNGKSALATW